MLSKSDIIRYNKSEVRGMKHIFMMKYTKKHHDFESCIHEVMSGYDYEVVYRNCLADSQKYVRNVKEKARFYIAGGDGTIHGLIQCLIDTEHEIVVLPMGTGNDFCRTLTSMKKPKEILEESLQYETQKVDAIALNDTYYINAACFGLDSVIANHVHDTPNIPLVPDSKSYIISILQNTMKYKDHSVTIYSDGKLLYQGNMILCTLNNAQYYGGGFQIIPHADIQDGYMDICVVDQVPKWKIPYMVERLVRHKLNGRKDVHYFRVKNAKVICQYACNIDGEEKQYDHYDFQIKPECLNIVTFKKPSN